MNKLKGLARILLIPVWLLLPLVFLVNALGVSMYIKGTNITASGSVISAAQGTTILLYKQVGNRDPLNSSGIPAPAGIDGADTTLTPLDPSSLTPINLTITDGNIINGAGQAGDRYIKVDVNPGDTIYARVWSPSAGLGNFYKVTAYSFPSDTTSFNALTNPTWDWTNLTLDYKAAAPPTPAINRAGIIESSVRQGETDKFSVALYVPVNPGASYAVESAMYQVKVWRDDLNDDPDPVSPATAATARDVRVIDSASITFTFANNPTLADVYKTYFQGNKIYHMKVAAYNVFGVTDYSADISPAWTTGGGGSVSATLNLAPGLNFFSLGVPSAGGKWYVGATQLTTVQNLIDAIGQDRVSTFGYVDATGTVVGVRNQGGTLTGTTGFTGSALSQTQGYQVFITPGAPISLTIKNSQ
jgi:hypothetical protein